MDINISIDKKKKTKDSPKSKGKKKSDKNQGKKDNKRDSKKDKNKDEEEQCQWPPDQQTIIIASSISGTVTAAIAALIIVVALIPPPVTLMIQSGYGNELWIRAMVDKFNGSPHFTTTGALINVELNITDSDLDIDREPHLWIPASSLYINMWNQSGMINSPFCTSSSSSPMGIAMWKSMADLLGWNTGDITWEDIHNVAVNGWTSVGGTGEFKYAHTSPQLTHSGLVSILSQVHAFSGLKSELEYDNIYNVSASTNIQELEDKIIYYGNEDDFLLNMMLLRGIDIIHAVITYESNVIKYNMEHAANLAEQLVFIYPVDGMFWNDHPLCVLNNTDFTAPEQADAAQVFIEFLLEGEQQNSAVQYGVRPADISADITSIDGNNITVENGAIPTVSAASTTPLPLPKESVVTQVKNLWKQTRSPATVYLLLDSSLNMVEDNKIKGAIDSALALVKSMDPSDRLIISTFNDTVSNINDLYLGGDTQLSLIQSSSILTYQLQSLEPQEGYNLPDSFATALDNLQTIKAADVTPGRYSLVVVNNGIFNATEQFPTYEDFLDYLPLSDDPTNVKLYTFAYGNSVDGFTQELLKTVATNGNGKYYQTNPDDIVDLFVELASEF